MLDREFHALVRGEAQVPIGQRRCGRQNTVLGKHVQDRSRQRPSWRRVGDGVGIAARRNRAEVDVVVQIVDVGRQADRGAAAEPTRCMRFHRRSATAASIPVQQASRDRQGAADRAHDQRERIPDQRLERGRQERRDAAQVGWHDGPDVQKVVDHRRRQERPVKETRSAWPATGGPSRRRAAKTPESRGRRTCRPGRRSPPWRGRTAARPAGNPQARCVPSRVGAMLMSKLLRRTLPPKVST